jgi:hypothetical protein
MKDQEDEQKRTVVLDGPAKTTNRPRHLAVDSRAGRYVTLTSRRALELDSCISDRIVPRSALSRTGLDALLSIMRTQAERSSRGISERLFLTTGSDLPRTGDAQREWLPRVRETPTPARSARSAPSRAR